MGYGREFTDEVVTATSGPNPFINQLNTSQIAGLGIEISQPLLRGGRTYVARQKILDARYDNESTRAELKGRILQVTAETKGAYYARSWRRHGPSRPMPTPVGPRTRERSSPSRPPTACRC